MSEENSTENTRDRAGSFHLQVTQLVDPILQILNGKPAVVCVAALAVVMAFLIRQVPEDRRQRTMDDIDGTLGGIRKEFNIPPREDKQA